MKKHILLGILTVITLTCFAWEPPKMQCLKLMNNNTRMKMAWSSNGDCIHFKVYYFYINDVLCDSLFGYSSATQSFTLCDYGSKDINNIPVASEYYCYIIALDSNDNAYYSDTIHSISLTVTPQANNTLAFLEWESPTTTLDVSWGNTFDIFKKRDFEPDFPPEPFASVPNSVTHFTDTSDVCDNIISYQISITNFYGVNERCPFMTTIGSAHLVDSTSPAPPVLDSVTVTANNEIMLGFHETEPYMMAYIIYYISPNGTIPLDTIYGQTYWIDPIVDPSFDSRYYRIATMDSCGNVSALTDDQQCNMTLHLQNADACHRSATIQWSTYANLHGDINHFEVMLSSNQGQSWTNLGSTTSNNYQIDNLELNHQYIAYVRVVNNGGTITASTNRINIKIQADESQDFTYIRSVSVIDNEYIRIRVLTSGDTIPFVRLTLQRSEDGVNFENFKTKSYIPGTADYDFADSNANFSRNTYYYRTYLFNTCEVDAGYSNVSHNILLRGENNAQNNVLTWHGYDNWDGDVAYYYVMRKVENEELFNTVNQVQPGTVNSYSDDISSLYESGSKFVYYIEAQENPNNYGIDETSLSNQITVTQPPAIYIPNAFRPLGANNNVFKPVNSFVSIDGYRFSIFTRTGECIFITTNPQEGWDGRINGVVAPMNVYVYYMEYKMPDGTQMERTGTVTLVK
ncbi:MAG: gliding motility-associated C-terminal domain-containing protein [Bacteroidales bacterium]|nr:gliding motility-associated C-terminal domain-containing protein [Bacteroidales bacterium]